MAIRVACAYNTVSTNAILVIASMLPLKQMANERRAIYEAKRLGLAPSTKSELRRESLCEWKKEWQESNTRSWKKRLIQDLQPCVSSSFGTLNYHLMQFLTGHSCFGNYLMTFMRSDTSICYDCMDSVDNAEHALFKCDRWWRLRRELEDRINTEINPETVVKAILKSTKNWRAVTNYVVHVLNIREDERQRKRQSY